MFIFQNTKVNKTESYSGISWTMASSSFHQICKYINHFTVDRGLEYFCNVHLSAGFERFNFEYSPFIYSEGDFHLFDSGKWYNDLIFTDDAVRLMRLPKNKQDYRNYLGQDFINKVENLHKYTCVPVKPSSASPMSVSIILMAAFVIFQRVL